MAKKLKLGIIGVGAIGTVHATRQPEDAGVTETVCPQVHHTPG